MFNEQTICSGNNYITTKYRKYLKPWKNRLELSQVVSKVMQYEIISSKLSGILN